MSIMNRLTDRLTADVASSILNEHIESIKNILLNNSNKRFITLAYPSVQILDQRIKNITNNYDVMFISSEIPPGKEYTDAYPAIKLAINNKSLICVCIATYQNDLLITHCASSFMII